MEAYEGMYKSAKIRVEYESAFKLKTSHIKLFINGKLADTAKRTLREFLENYTLQSVIVIDGEELVVVAQIKSAEHLVITEPEVYVGNIKIPMIKVS